MRNFQIVCSIVAVLVATSAAQAIDDDIRVSAERENSPATGPFVVIDIEGMTPNGGNNVELAGWTRDGNTLQFFVDWNMGTEPEESFYFQRFAIPAPPEGEYTLSYLARPRPDESFEEVASTSAEVVSSWPEGGFSAFIWPPHPTPLTPVTYYFTPFNACQPDLFRGTVTNEPIPDEDALRDRIVVEMSRDPCERIQVPELDSIELGRLQTGTHRLSATFQPDDIIIDPPPGLDIREFEVRAALPGRLSGAWFNPAQNGHGLTLEVLDDGQRLAATWFTFDANGEQAWLIANGSVNEAGMGATMDATLVEGGRFPPNFDPDEVTG